MTNQQILEKAIQKAIDGGWKPEDEFLDEDNPYLLARWIIKDSHSPGTYNLIFNHNFAKALWGESNAIEVDGCRGHAPHHTYAWMHHLQQMVIADDPIKYLEENI